MEYVIDIRHYAILLAHTFQGEIFIQLEQSHF
jgi:hypothetical protein